MPFIKSIAHALPPYRVTQAEIQQYVRKIFAGSSLNIDDLMPVFANAGIETRYLSVPPEWYDIERSFSEKNEKYIETATALGAEAAEKALEKAGLRAVDIDYLIFISTTGLATPSIDARLINVLHMRSNIRRTPVWGLGCAGGAAGLSQAYHYLRGHPDEKVLLVAVELCGLTFQQNDFSKSNFVAAALFGDGASAVVLSGDKDDSGGVEIVGTRSTFWPDSLDVMGWNIYTTGLQVVFSRRIPDIVHAHARVNFESFLKEFELTLDEISYFILHPGGAKVLDAYNKALNLSNGKLDICRRALRDFGNVSAVSVLLVLEEHIRQYSYSDGEYGLISALGPGFCAENLLVKF